MGPGQFYLNRALPTELARWRDRKAAESRAKAKRPDPNRNPPLPQESDRSFELEVAKAHGGYVAWLTLPAERKAELIAHEIENAMRSQYAAEDLGANKGNEGPGSFAAIKRQMGIL